MQGRAGRVIWENNSYPGLVLIVVHYLFQELAMERKEPQRDTETKVKGKHDNFDFLK
jgi:hypothetical protein